MKKLAVVPLYLGCFFTAATTSHAVDLKQSKVTQVVNDVEIISAADQKEKAATINDLFNMPDILRTGASSRAELVAADETVTRVGANTIFSFDPANRTIDLKQGSLLFHSPHGKGGGTIHTGSATASVLGTTIIVVSTPNGGFKVLSLEGEVEVKFLNGLKQKLDPGQMTFILPGANQLAPVIVFRLDELTGNSQLVKGFTQPLASLPLIQNQISQQLKLITSGKVTDTGLYAGDTATQTQVEVLDANTITGGENRHHQQPQNAPPPPPNSPPPPPRPPGPNLTAAEAADATINQSSLTDVSIPTPPQHVINSLKFPVPGSIYFGGQTFSGFVARNIYVNTTPVDTGETPAAAAPLSVNMSPYAALPAFDIVAVNNFSIEGSVTFSGLAAKQDFSLIAGGQFSFTPGISIRADCHDFTLSSPLAMDFDNVGLFNADKDINLNSGDSITLEDSSTVNVGGRFIVSAANDINFLNSGDSLNPALTSASALFTSLSGSINVENSVLEADTHINFLAPVSINLRSSTLSANSVSVFGSTAGSTINIHNTTINAPGAITVVSDGDINVTGSNPENALPSAKAVTLGGSALNADGSSGSVSLISESGAVNVSGTSISAHFLTLSSGDGILLDGRGHAVSALGSGATANFSDSGVNSKASITVNNADLSSFSVVNMAANTINLMNVAFGEGSAVTLRSLYGVLAANPNTGAASVPGDVNFISGVTYAGDPAQNHIGSGINIGTLH